MTIAPGRSPTLAAALWLFGQNHLHEGAIGCLVVSVDVALVLMPLA